MLTVKLAMNESVAIFSNMYFNFLRRKPQQVKAFFGHVISLLAFFVDTTKQSIESIKLALSIISTNLTLKPSELFLNGIYILTCSAHQINNKNFFVVDFGPYMTKFMKNSLKLMRKNTSF